MAILSNVALYYVRCNPTRPNRSYDPAKPTWDAVLRTTDPQQKAEWESQGCKPKLMVHKSGEEEGMPLLTEAGQRQWQLRLRKRAYKKDGTENQPVEVVGGGLQPLDPDTIGNGSIGNVRIFQYTYGDEGKVASVLQAIQIKKLRKVEPRTREEFAAEDMEYFDEDPLEDGDAPAASAAKPSAPKPPAPKAPAPKLADARPEDAF
jgi:hypothetical protein